MDKLYKQIAKIGRQYGAAKVLYGSRARGDNRQRSDIDLAIYGIDDRGRQAQLAQAIEDLPTLLDFDLVFVRADTDPKLLQNIEKDGVSLMSKYEEKRDKFKDAVQRHRQLHTAEIRGKMPTGVRHVFHKKLADVPAKLRNVPFRYGTEIGIAVYSI